MIWLERFIEESWRIEGLWMPHGIPADILRMHRLVLNATTPTVELMEEAALLFTDRVGELRRREGMDVQVGSHVPRGGGDVIEQRLKLILHDAARITSEPYHVHREYEDLHPFMDGNGRTGRLLWAWMMQRRESDTGWRKRGFLHTWYYQSLEAGR